MCPQCIRRRKANRWWTKAEERKPSKPNSSDWMTALQRPGENVKASSAHYPWNKGPKLHCRIWQAEPVNMTQCNPDSCEDSFMQSSILFRNHAWNSRYRNCETDENIFWESIFFEPKEPWRDRAAGGWGEGQCVHGGRRTVHSKTDREGTFPIVFANVVWLLLVYSKDGSPGGHSLQTLGMPVWIRRDSVALQPFQRQHCKMER